MNIREFSIFSTYIVSYYDSYVKVTLLQSYSNFDGRKYLPKSKMNYCVIALTSGAMSDYRPRMI